MDQLLLLLGLVAATSAGAYWLGVKGLALQPGRLGAALAHVAEFAGLAVLFFIANAGAGVLVVLGIRGLFGRFVSIYVIDDLGWVVLSVLQALTFQWWRAMASRT